MFVTVTIYDSFSHSIFYFTTPNSIHYSSIIMTHSSSITPSAPQQQQQSRRRRKGAALSTTVALMLAYGVTPSECFHPVAGFSAVEHRAPTRRFFRDSADPLRSPEGGAAAVTTNFDPVNLFQPRGLLGSPAPSVTAAAAATAKTRGHDMPTWLSQSKAHLWEQNWMTLKTTMLESSFFSASEAQRLRTAIVTAARGDRNKMAGAAEFCLILVDTMELGLNALLAAAFHYSSCVSARERALLIPPSFSMESTSKLIWGDDDMKDKSFGYHASFIAKDAQRLKQLEMVADMILRNSDKASHRVTPDSKDAENLSNLLMTETKDWRALAIRSAASLYRLRGILSQTQDSGERIQLTAEARQASREALHIYAPLAERLGMHRLKNELEGAAFKILYRRQYEKVNKLARELRPKHSSKPHLNQGLLEMCENELDVSSCMRTVLEQVKAEMTAKLQEDAYFSDHVQDFSVTARVKEPYSMWKKMLRNKSQHILEVPDALALRIVLDAKKGFENDEVRRATERALCYYAQHLCTEQWKPVEGDPRFKDYVERPKRNGYQSLHYTAHTDWGGDDWKLEIQVRSGEMHNIAEFGLASHWEYKAQQNAQQKKDAQPDNIVTIKQGGKSVTGQSSDAYLRSVQEWHWQQHAGKSQNDAAAKASPAEYAEEGIDLARAAASAAPAGTSASESEERAERIRARTKMLEPYIQAWTAAQSNLVRENVFVFLSSSSQEEQGKVLALPAGACVLDALREGEKEFGFKFPLHQKGFNFSHNGDAASTVTSKLQNGDILSVPYPTN